MMKHACKKEIGSIRLIKFCIQFFNSSAESPRTSPQQDFPMDENVVNVLPPLTDPRFKDVNHSTNATTRSLPTVSSSCMKCNTRPLRPCEWERERVRKLQLINSIYVNQSHSAHRWELVECRWDLKLNWNRSLACRWMKQHDFVVSSARICHVILVDDMQFFLLPTQIRGVEIGIVVLVLMVWAGAIGLFFNRWGKIRMLLPYQPDYKQDQLKVPGAATCPPGQCNGHQHQVTLFFCEISSLNFHHHMPKIEFSPALSLVGKIESIFCRLLTLTFFKFFCCFSSKKNMEKNLHKRKTFRWTFFRPWNVIF